MLLFRDFSVVLYHCVRCSNNALLLTAFGVDIVWYNQQMNGAWDAYLASPADFAGADDIITNLEREKEPGIEISKRTP